MPGQTSLPLQKHHCVLKYFGWLRMIIVSISLWVFQFLLTWFTISHTVYSITLVANIHILPQLIGQVFPVYNIYVNISHVYSNLYLALYCFNIVFLNLEDCHARNTTTDCDDNKIQNFCDDNNTILASSEAFYKLCASQCIANSINLFF